MAWMRLLASRFLGYPVKRGPVLIVDAELHVETLANRYHSVALAMGVPFEQIEQNIGGMILRGDTCGGLERLMADLTDIEPGSLNLVILDARYRFTEELDENSNRDMTLFHNLADQLAVQLDSAVVMIHHSSKGTQSHKDVVDVGSGAGSQARAVDSHLVIRDHEESDCSVLDAAVRSWPPMRSRTIRFDFPLWQPAVDISPLLKQHRTPHEDKMAARLDSRIEQALEVFEQQTEPISKNRLRDLTGLNNDQANKVLVEMLDRELLIASRGVARNKMEIDLYELAKFEGEQLDSDVDGVPSEMNRTPSDSVSDGTEYPGTE